MQQEGQIVAVYQLDNRTVGGDNQPTDILCRDQCVVLISQIVAEAEHAVGVGVLFVSRKPPALPVVFEIQ